MSEYYGDGTPSWLHDVAEPQFRDLYARAGRMFDFDTWTWPSRLGFSVGAGLSKEESLAIHLAECRAELHLAPPVADPMIWHGAFCIPDALPRFPFGDGKRIWTPAFGCYDPIGQRAIMDALHARRYSHIIYQLSGYPYSNHYPRLLIDAVRAQGDLSRLKADGFVTVAAFDDTRGVDCSYLSLIAELTQDVVDWVMGPFEINDGRSTADINSILLQKAALWPHARQAVHFTPQHGAGGSPEWDWWAWAATEARITALLGQDNQFSDPVGTGRGLESTAKRLLGLVGGDVPEAWRVMAAHPVETVAFEQTTTETYNGRMSEAQQIAFTTAMLRECPHVIGWCDGGTP